MLESFEDEYERETGKKAVVDGQETIGFKRWKKQHKKNRLIYNKTIMGNKIDKHRKALRNDFKNIFRIYLEYT